MKGCIVFVVVLVLGVREVEMIPEAMKHLTIGFMRVVEECKTELGISDGILSDLYHLWKEEYDQVGRDTGCMFGCMSKKLELLDGGGNLHHGNIQDFVLNNGGDKDIASQLLPIAQSCEKQHESVADECERMLGMAKCFRSSLKQVQWTPRMEVVITEIVAEV